ncbi:MAG TPA: 1,6-anhydro-N-acetylmuramyl-L-alanine amidase AmpD [Gammaproteobacteria bacterium]
MHFEIRDHRIVGIPFLASPFADARPEEAQPELVVVHGISLPPGEFGGRYVEEFFLGQLNPDAHEYFAAIRGMEVSAHLFMRRDGEMIQFVPFDRRAWHAGRSAWCGRERCNDFSIGIELEGTDDCPYDPRQYEALAAVIDALRTAYPGLRDEAIVGHSDIAPGRKTDPGPSFDWDHLRRCMANRCL